MFLLFNIVPVWIWLSLPILAIGLFFVSYLPQLSTYSILVRGISALGLTTSIFILGMLYSDNTWKTASRELEQRVAELSIKSAATNEVIKEKLITKVQLVKVRGDTITEYIDKNIPKYNSSCVIPTEFVIAHNKAAEEPK